MHELRQRRSSCPMHELRQRRSGCPRSIPFRQRKDVFSRSPATAHGLPIYGGLTAWEICAMLRTSLTS